MKRIRIFNFLIVDLILPGQVVRRASVKTLSPFNSFRECVDLIESDPSIRNVNRKSPERNRTNILAVTNSQTFKPGISVGWQMVRRYVKYPSLQECVDRPEELEPPQLQMAIAHLWRAPPSHKSRLMWLSDGLGDGARAPPPRGFLDLDRVQHVRSSTLIFTGTGPTTSSVRALIVRRRREWCCNCSSLPPGRRVIFCILPLLVVLFALIGTDLEVWLMTTLRFTSSWKYGPYGQTGL